MSAPDGFPWVHWWHEGKWRETSRESLFHLLIDGDRTACGRMVPLGAGRGYTTVEGRDPQTVCRVCARHTKAPTAGVDRVGADVRENATRV